MARALVNSMEAVLQHGAQEPDLTQVDRVFLSHPLLRDAAAFLVSGPDGTSHLACAVVPNASALLQRASLRVFAARALPAELVPKDICFVEEVPRSPTGRPRRRSLAKQVLARRQADDALAQAETTSQDLSTLETGLLCLWRSLLGNPTLSPDEDFFSAGGDEVSAEAMLLDIKRIHGLRFRLLYESFAYEPTLFHLAHMVLAGQEMRAPQSSEQHMKLVVVRDPQPNAVITREHPLLYLLPPDGDEGTCFRKLSDALGPGWPIAVVRPAGLLHKSGPYQLEEAAREAAALIQDHSAGRPFAVGGFCYGGLIAAEIAHRMKQTCGALVLFDTPLCGHPHFPLRFQHGRDHLRWAGAMLRELRKAGGPVFCAKRVVRVSLWHGIRILRPALVPLWTNRVFQRIAREASTGDFPVYIYLKPLHLPVLHMYSTGHSTVAWRESVLDWHQVAPGCVTMSPLTGAHLRLFFGANLGKMARELPAWFQSQFASLAAAALPREASAAPTATHELMLMH